LTREGAELRGTMVATDKHHVAERLRERGMSLQWCKEIGKEDIHAETAVIQVVPSAEVPQEGVVEKETPAVSPPDVTAAGATSSGLLDWIVNHSGGSIQTKPQALGILLFILIILVATTFNAIHALRPSYPGAPSGMQSNAQPGRLRD
jgi:hypothetical protein